MKVLFMMSHPAHFHMFKNVIACLQKDRHGIVTVIRPKDILEQLCVGAQIPFIKVKARPKSASKLCLGIALLERTIEVCRIVHREKPDFMIGSDGVIAVAGKLYGIPSFEFFDDDYETIKLYADIFFPIYTGVIASRTTDAGKFHYKKIEFDGNKKLTYLWPKYFTPTSAVVKQYNIDSEKPYFLLRLSALNAHHDNGVSGISNDVAQRLINILRPHGQVYITSERSLEPQFEQYRLHINPLDIHHIMAFATLYIGDSQSMAVEAAMLGTPCLRFNDFVGAKKIGVMEELEHTYGLTYGISSHEPEKLYAKIEELMAMPNLREEFQKRRQKMLSEKIDVTAFLVYFIEGYPATVKEVKNADENFWKRFK
ncbi:MAG: DUF354 domain-containing protein [Paludibacteraceae bacterium]